jgi:diadenosine tetraphosphate (Ap4A) HIT family hydrolase
VPAPTLGAHAPPVDAPPLTAGPFASPRALRERFVTGLSRLLLGEPRLGPFIVVLNNALYDPAIHERLGKDLAHRFEALADRCRGVLRQGRDPDEPPDDLAVFLRLMAIGVTDLPLVERRCAGPWEIQCNPLRGLRPARAAAGRPEGNRAPFDPRGFHFNKPFLRREAFWQGTLAGVELELLFNKYPFADLHTLLVPKRLENAPQYLQRQQHEAAWAMTQVLARSLPGIGLGYNSYGAFASVNHLHFQLFLRSEPLPVADPCWRHNGGDTPYPIACAAFQAPDQAWDAIAQLNESGASYNTVYTSQRLYCIPRRRQGTYGLPAWCGGQAWYELSGGVVALTPETFAALTLGDIHAGIAAADLDPERPLAGRHQV